VSIAIEVNKRHTRSVNLERDKESTELITGYIPTSRALRTLEKISESVQEKETQRSWSLIGPYGSGKSSFALFLSQLLGLHDERKNLAFEVMREAAPDLASLFEQQPISCLIVPIVGAPEPLAFRLLKTMFDQARVFYRNRKGPKPKVLKDIEKSLGRGEVTHSEFLGFLRTLSLVLERAGVNGLVFVIDELGKFLEYEVRHYGANDIYLLQSLAEESANTESFFILNFVLLHQSMEQYAKGLSQTLKNEWGKIQGRFEEVPFLESAEQTLKVIGRVFRNKASSEEQLAINKAFDGVLGNRAFVELLPSSLEKNDARELLQNCYPLHPVTALLLPHLCQKVAQNERTLFSYLGSREDFGVMSLVNSLNPGEYVLPHHAFDYFVRNQSLSSSDFVTQKRWIEVITSLDRAADLDITEVQLLKTIGLLNIIGVKGQLKASEELLKVSMGLHAHAFNACLKTLQSKSLVNFRKFSGEYRIWQGSDFDLDQAVVEEIANLGQFSVADELNRSELLLPIVVKRYTIENATLRYFRPLFIDAKSYLKVPQEADEPRVIFFLAYASDDKKVFPLLKEFFSESDVLVQCSSSDHIRSAVAEVIALRKVGSSNHELDRDPIAKREYQERIDLAEQFERKVLNDFLEQPDAHLWEHMGRRLEIAKKKDLQVQLSNCLRRIYSISPIFKNELINRDRPSTQAVMARNKLMKAMNNHSNDFDLGFQPTSFPAEKAMYRALFHQTGIHHVPKSKSEQATFRKPVYTGQGSVLPVWERIEEFIKTTEKQPLSFVELNKVLMTAPYGVKAGILPLLYFAVYLVNQSSMGVFEKRRFRPRFTDEMVERFSKRPDEFTFQYFKIEGLKNSLFQHYERALFDGRSVTKKGRDKSVLDLVRPLAAFMGGLPEYTQTTREGLSDRAQKVRSAFNLAKSPNDLIFFDLPGALGFSSSDKLAERDLEDFSVALTEVIHEFRDCYKKLIDRFRVVLSQGLGREESIDLAECRRACGNLYGLEHYSQDVKSLGGLISRLTKVQAENNEWFENILMYLGRKPSSGWTDTDANNALYRLKDFLRQINDLEKIRIETKKRDINDPNVDFFLLKVIQTGGVSLDRVVVVDRLTEEKIGTTLQNLTEELLSLKDKELRAACLARLMTSILGQETESNDELLLNGVDATKEAK
jgi:hypothetical protein